MKRSTSVWLLCLTLATLSGCGAAEEHHQDLPAMDTIMEFTVCGSHGEEGIAQCKAIVSELEGLLSVTDAQSEVYALNQSGTLDDPSPHLLTLLALAEELGTRTGGALDVTIYPVVRAWGFTGEEYRVPDAEELAELLERVDLSALAWDSTQVSLPSGMMLDFGSLAKGYAGALAADALRELGVTSALLNLGGNVQTVGSRPDGTAWRVAVKDPADPDSTTYLGVLALQDEAAVTSGSYERGFEEDGVRYGHIIDPATGYPADSDLLSVTVVGTDGALCDGLSTALFILGRDAALDYWSEWGGFELVLVGTDGIVTVTAGLEERFELTNDAYTLTVAE